jgi:hypothetical protein
MITCALTIQNCITVKSRVRLVGSEGAMAVFMNIPYFFEFLDWQLSSGLSGDSILMKNLFIILQLVEMIALF